VIEAGKGMRESLGRASVAGIQQMILRRQAKNGEQDADGNGGGQAKAAGRGHRETSRAKNHSNNSCIAGRQHVRDTSGDSVPVSDTGKRRL
jgi:hypothetical protein